MGGIKVVYGISKAQIDTITVTDGVVTGITTNVVPDSDPSENYKFHTYKFRKQSSSMTSTYTIDDTNGVKYVTTELTLNFAKQETAKRVSLTALINCESVFVVEDMNGKMWLLGYETPVTATAAEAQTGTAYGDANQYSLTMSDMSAEFPMEVNITDFVADLTTEA